MAIWDFDNDDNLIENTEIIEEEIVEKYTFKGNGDDNKTLHLEDFVYRLLDRTSKRDLYDTRYIAEQLGFSYVSNHLDVYDYVDDELIICPEPLTFIRKYDDVSDDIKLADKRFRKESENFYRLYLGGVPKYYDKEIWKNKTLNGINLRPGKFMGVGEEYIPIQMNDDNVHGLIVGRTGSGKSVFINQLILNLITEYSPWEIDIYLADFKKVELSRYMSSKTDNTRAEGNSEYTPHVKACAATSEVRYVVSMLRNLVEKMNARQEMFSRLGVTKLKEFRQKYNIVLPRVILIIDEFQQMFTEASSKEEAEIQFLLNSITKLGRATGFHLIFASQEMTGTLSGSTLSNFKIKMALPCNSDISSEILGNNAAANLERGYVLVNTAAGNELDNKKFKVPFLETEIKNSNDDGTPEKSDFFKFLDKIRSQASKFDLTYKSKTQKFYKEDLQERESDFITDLEKVKNGKNTVIEKRKDLFDAWVLGKTVLYSEKSNDKVTMYIDKGRNKGMLLASPSNEDLARMRKLIFENLSRLNGPTRHIELDLNKLTSSKFSVKESCNNSKHNQKYIELSQSDFLFYMVWSYKMSQYMQEIIKDSDYKEVLDQVRKYISNNDVCSDDLQDNIAVIEKAMEDKEKCIETVENPFKLYIEDCNDTFDTGDEDVVKILEALQHISVSDEEMDVLMLNPLKLYKELDGSLVSIDEMMESDNVEDIDELNFIQYKIYCLRDFVGYYINLTYDTDYEIAELIINQASLVYDKYEDKINKYKEQHMLIEELEDLKNKLKSLKERESQTDKINIFIRTIMENVYRQMDYNLVDADNAYYPEFKSTEYGVVTDNSNKEINNLINSDMTRFLNDLLFYKKDLDFVRTIFWLNGADEIDDYPSNVHEVISNGLNQDCMVILSCSTELSDTLLYRCIDYLFITGNLENIYDRFGIVYTKQKFNSIVINAAVKSKGIVCPFKIYRSDLAEAVSETFLEDMLEE